MSRQDMKDDELKYDLRRSKQLKDTNKLKVDIKQEKKSKIIYIIYNYLYNTMSQITNMSQGASQCVQCYDTLCPWSVLNQIRQNHALWEKWKKHQSRDSSTGKDRHAVAVEFTVWTDDSIVACDRSRYGRCSQQARATQETEISTKLHTREGQKRGGRTTAMRRQQPGEDRDELNLIK